MHDTPFEAACPCGSGQRYIDCCGQLDPRIWDEQAPGRLPGRLTDERWQHFVAREPRCHYRGEALPPGIFIRELDDAHGWREIANYVSGADGERDARINSAGSVRKTIWRETQVVDPGPKRAAVTDLVRLLFRDEAEPFYGRAVRSLETPYILRYSTGCYYRPHADSDEINFETQKWEKKLDRDLSLLVYLDDDYSGGEIAFPNFAFRFRPRAGTLLLFPSDCRYLHGVLPVTEGIRHTIVSWCALSAGSN